MIVLEPLIVAFKFEPYAFILCSIDLSSEIVEQVAFRGNMSEKVRDITEVGGLWADVAMKWNGSHSSD